MNCIYPNLYFLWMISCRALCQPLGFLLPRLDPHQLLYHGLQAQGHEDCLGGDHVYPLQLVRGHQVLEAELKFGFLFWFKSG